MVSAETIGPKGRVVRCQKCGNQWFQAAEKDSLDDLISRIQAEEFDEIGFDDKGMGKLAKNHAPHSQSGLFQLIKNKFNNFRDWQRQKTLNLRLKRHKMRSLIRTKTFDIGPSKSDLIRYAVSMILAIIATTIILGVLMLTRGYIIKLYAPAQKIYDLVGIATNQNREITSIEIPTAAEELEQYFALDHVKFEDGLIKGELINLTNKARKAPSLVIISLSENNQILATETHVLPKEDLEAEAVMPISLSLSKDINTLRGVSKLLIKFAIQDTKTKALEGKEVSE